MKLSNKKLELIRPEILNMDDRIQAWFTCKNAELNESSQHISGLNLGFNTSENKDIVKQHRKSLLSELDIKPQHIAYAEQVHGSKVKVVKKGDTYDGVDALITQTPGLTLAIQVADCAAILLADSQRGIIAAVHAGWRGAAGDILQKAIRKMKLLGAETSNMKAFISPCISKQNFEVGSEVAERFPAEFVDYETYKKPHVDLKGFLKKQLQEHGLKEEFLDVHDECTVANAQRYYSYRREQQQSGRMLGLIRICKSKLRIKN